MVAANPDPAIALFLTLLDQGIATGQQLSTLPLGLAKAMLLANQQPADLGENIAGDVAL